jgi:K+-sensing histidine kinase KdpD
MTITLGIAWLLLIPAGILFLASRPYHRQRSQNESLEFLYESTRMLQGSLDMEAAQRALLQQVRKMFRAEIARVTLFAIDGDPSVHRTTLGPDDHWNFMDAVALDPRKGVWARVASEEQAVVVPKPIRNEKLRAYFKDEGMRDAMVAPLIGDGRVIGTLLVGSRVGASTFDKEDLKLFETFTNHASISLENARLVTQLRESLSKMTELNRARDEFVATVSHELRTPLTCIIGFVKTLLRPDVEYSREETKEMLVIAERQSENLQALIEDLLLVSRIESRPIESERSDVSVGDLLREIVDGFAARTTDHRFELYGVGSSFEIHTDESALRRILSNLVENALKYSPAQTTVRISARREGVGMRFTVEDQGPGIPGAARDRIFDRFFQLDQSNTRKAGGVGLGLYICKSLADSIDGTLSVGEAPGGGAAFTLWITEGVRALEDSRVHEDSLPPLRLRAI